MRALAWLFSAHGFKTPFACGGWSPLLISASVVSNGVIALIFFSIPWFLLRFRRVHEPPKIFRRSQMSGWYSAIFIACGVSHALRAVTFFYPFYRLQTLSVVVTGAVSWAAICIMVPVILSRTTSEEERVIELLATRIVADRVRAKAQLELLQGLSGSSLAVQHEVMAAMHQIEALVAQQGAAATAGPAAEGPAAEGPAAEGPAAEGPVSPGEKAS